MRNSNVNCKPRKPKIRVLFILRAKTWSILQKKSGKDGLLRNFTMTIGPPYNHKAESGNGPRRYFPQLRVDARRVFT